MPGTGGERRKPAVGATCRMRQERPFAKGLANTEETLDSHVRALLDTSS